LKEFQMTCASAFSRLMGSLLTLLPLCLAAESQIAANGSGRQLSAAAHVDFRIIIPRVLALDVASDTRGPGAQRVAVFSNSRTATLSSTLPGLSLPANRSVILVAAARKVIAEETLCVSSSGINAGTLAGAAGKPHGMICTVSMP
jgi:hypothetical protein